MPLSAVQSKVAKSKARFRTCVFGRRSGKTTLAIREMIKFASQPNKNIWYVSPSYRMSKEIVWHKLCDMLLDLRWVAKKNESELTLYLKNGSMISLKGSDNRDSLRGRSIDFLVLDEAADIHPSVFFEVLRPALADTKGHSLFLGTPKGLGNFLKDLYDKALVDENWESFHATTQEGGFVEQEEIEEAKHILDSRTFAQEMLADFIESGQKIMYNFDLDDSVKNYPYGDDIPNTVHIAHDFNVGMMTSVCYDVQNDGTMWAFDEIVLSSSNTDEMVIEIKNRFPVQNIICYPDPSAKANKSSAGGRTDISILQNAGFTIKAPNRHNPVRDTINAVNSMLKNAGGVRRMYFDPKCRQTIKSMDRWQYKENTMIPEKDGAVDHSHLCDCVRYITDYLNPIRKTFEPQAVGRWGHKTY